MVPRPMRELAECLLSLALLLLFRRYLLWLALHVAVNAVRTLLLWKRTKKEFPSYLTETPLPLMLHMRSLR